MRKGDRVVYTATGGNSWEATVATFPRKGKVDIVIDGDPFPVTVETGNIKTCGTVPQGVRSGSESGTSAPDRRNTVATKTRAERLKEVRALKDEAVGLGIAGANDMTRDELTAAITKAKAPAAAPAASKAPRKAKSTGKVAPRKGKASTKPSTVAPEPEPAAEEEAPPARKSRSKKAPATKATSKPKAAPKAAEPVSDEPADPAANPFRKGSDRHFLYTLLLKGGTRQALADKAAKRLNLRSYSDSKREPDVHDYDKRLLLTAQVLRDEHGFEFVKEGRGLAGRIKVVPPTEVKVRKKGRK